MGYPVSLTSMIYQCQQRSNMENNNFVTTLEITTMINGSGAELHGRLASAYGENYQMNITTFTTVSTTDTYNLPIDFFKLNGASLLVNNSTEIPMRRYQMNERGRYQNNPYVTAYSGGRVARYMLAGTSGNNGTQTIRIAPFPNAGTSILIYYTPVWATLVNGTDVYDCIDGFEEYIILDVCGKIMNKQELDSSTYDQRKALMMQRIEKEKLNRDIANAQRVVSSSDDSLYPYFGGGYFNN